MGQAPLFAVDKVIRVVRGVSRKRAGFNGKQASGEGRRSSHYVDGNRTVGVFKDNRNIASWRLIPV